MSWQMAMISQIKEGVKTGLSTAQAISQGIKGIGAIDRGIESLHEAERQNVVETNLAVKGTEVRAGQYLNQAAQTDVLSAEVGIATKQQELSRRRELARLGQANAIDLVARGGMQTGQDSAGAIDQYNRAMAEEDVGNIRMMGESRQKQLSFRKKNFEFAAMGEGVRGAYARLAGAYKHENLEDQIFEAGQKAKNIGGDLFFKVLGQLADINMGSGGDSGSVTGNAAANAPSSVGGRSIEDFRGPGHYSYGSD